MSTSHKRTSEPFWWSLFGAGGVIAALFVPVLLFLFGLAMPLGWIEPLTYEDAKELAGHPLSRLFLFVVISLPMFHWAHRFRFTLYDGLQIKHLNLLVALFCYGSAVVVTVAAAIVLIRL